MQLKTRWCNVEFRLISDGNLPFSNATLYGNDGLYNCSSSFQYNVAFEKGKLLIPI